MILFITNLIIKFYNAFAIHKAIGKQASITKILLTGIFGIFSQTLTQLKYEKKKKVAATAMKDIHITEITNPERSRRFADIPQT